MLLGRQKISGRAVGEKRGEKRRGQAVRREVLDEIGSEIVQNHTGTRYRNANRDQARGDRDRSGRHADEERSRDQRSIIWELGLGVGS